MAKILGILGGMGPLATAHLFQKIISCTRADRDQEHLRIFIDNNTGVPDRTASLLGDGADPRPHLIDSAQKLETMGADFIIMPCNTAHAFYDDIVDAIDIPFLNMIEETARFIQAEFPDTSRAGLLATAGTCKTGVYDRVLKKYGIEVHTPSENDQKAVTALIYGVKQGILDMDLKEFYRTPQRMRTDDIDLFILGCTELSVAYDVTRFEGLFIDPLYVIATAAVRYAGKSVRNTL